MNILPRKYTVQSEKNGSITVKQFFGRTSVAVGGFEQTGTYLVRMMRGALKKLPAEKVVHTVLMVGLGGGGTIAEIEKRFPDAHITVVEWDSVMVDIAKDLHHFKALPEIIVGDMFEVLPGMHHQFDLVIVDVFYAGVPDQRLAEDTYTRVVAKVLAPGGFVILNLFKSLSFIPAFEKHMQLKDTWQFQYNTLALFCAR